MITKGYILILALVSLMVLIPLILRGATAVSSSKIYQTSLNIIFYLTEAALLSALLYVVLIFFVYPPRKKNDTSTGDALNWEWLIQCGKNLPGKIIIVSRDSDYGATVKNHSFINDHLLQEYKGRVGPRRAIQLTLGK